MRRSRKLLDATPQAAPAVLLVLLVLAMPPSLAAQPRRPITMNDLLAFQRITEPRISPDGASVVYTVATPDKTANRLARNIWIVPTASNGASSTAGSGATGRLATTARQLTSSGKDSGARWAPD